MPVLKEVLDNIALSKEEYDLIVKGLGREPNPVELGMFGALWSEHCGYKHSSPLLGLLPSSSPRVLLPPGEENAGVVDIGDGLAVVLKIESHNHPSAVEPFQGAATGVGDGEASPASHTSRQCQGETNVGVVHDDEGRLAAITH